MHNALQNNARGQKSKKNECREVMVGQLKVVPFGSLGGTPSADGIGTTFN
jgi:hypothetical protein